MHFLFFFLMLPYVYEQGALLGRQQTQVYSLSHLRNVVNPRKRVSFLHRCLPAVLPYFSDVFLPKAFLQQRWMVRLFCNNRVFQRCSRSAQGWPENPRGDRRWQLITGKTSFIFHFSGTCLCASGWKIGKNRWEKECKSLLLL